MAKPKIAPHQTLRDNRIWEKVWTLECRTPEIPSDLTKLPGYGDKKAKFTRTPIPAFMNEIALDENDSPVYTPEQTAFIKEEMRKCFLDGAWLYIRGELTWITPWMYLGLNYWPTSTVTSRPYLDYRDRQRRMLLFCWNVWKHTKDQGTTYLKFRQDGATTWMHIMAYVEVMRARNQFAGLSSSDFDLSEENYNELFVEPFKSIPKWLQPGIFSLNKNQFKLSSGGQKSTKGSSSVEEGRGSTLTLKALTRRGFDGRRLDFLGGDEGGKWEKVSISKWWAKQIPGLYGFAFLPTTNEEMEKGGAEYKKFWEKSDGTKIGKLGTTLSKCRNLFIPSSDGRPKFIGPYGESIIENPTDEQWAFMQSEYPDFFDRPDMRLGAKEYQDIRLAELLAAGDEDGYWEEKRQFPENPEDAFTALATNNPFEIAILDLLSITCEEVQGLLLRGYWAWADRNAKLVKWVKDDNGPILRSAYEPPNPCEYAVRGGMRVPKNGKAGAFGLDTYAKTNPKGKGSNQGMVGKLFFNQQYEVQNKSHVTRYGQNLPNYHPTPSFFYCHIHRHQQPGYDHEQALMAAIYYSMPIALENNRSESFENFATQRGLRGYLLKGWEILNTNPTRETEDVIGIATTQSEITKGGLVSDACEYHNDFLRGDSAYLGEFTYRLAEDPIRYPFKAAIKDNREFDILDREKSDGTMAMIPLYIYEYNVKGYVNPDNYLEKPEAPSYNARRFYRHFFHKSIKSLR